MEAIRIAAFGGPEVMTRETFATPAPGPGQVLVRIRAAGVNPVDVYIRAGNYGPRPFPHTPGFDAAGEVEALGRGVKGLKKGAYTMEISQVGYKRNDAFTAYIGMGSPKQLTRPQVATLKSIANGKPTEQKQVQVGTDGKLSMKLPLRENDVYLLNLRAAK